MTRSYRQGSGELRHHQLFHLQLIAERETGHRPLGAAELRAGRRPGVDEPSATDDLIPPAMGVPVDDHVGRTRFINPGSDRKSTRLNSSHSQISYAVFCLKKKKKKKNPQHNQWQ